MATNPMMSDVDTQRAAAAKRLKAAQRSMIVSGVLTVLLLVVTIMAFVSGRYSGAQAKTQTSALGVFAAIILVRFGIRGWRMYTTWHKLKEAQEAHRSLQ